MRQRDTRLNPAVALLIVAIPVFLPAIAWGTVQEVSRTTIVLEGVLSGLDQPVFLGHAGDGSNRVFILEQPGRILVLQPGASQATIFLNITNRVLCCGEQGLLGLAFHPQFASNRRFFVNYTRVPDGATIVAEYQASEADPNVANTAERVILTIPQPFSNHNGGMLAFGPDGYLYIGMGDGGSGNDPDNRAQNINDLLGKILRIDIDQLPYASPSANPFFGGTPGRDEIFAMGLRNPWRFSFDRLTSQLYVGDVGQNAREEIDLVTLGGNYGWRVFEGTLCTNLGPASCSATGFTPPVAEYGHDSGRCSVTGGYAYRGTASAFPPGGYFYGDFCSGEIFLLHGGVAQPILDTSMNISSFGEDESGELYVVDLGGSVSRIRTPVPVIASIVPASGLIGTTVNITLSGTGFDSPLSINAGNGVVASNIQVANSTLATATLAVASNPDVSCATSAVLAPGASTSFTLTVAVDSRAVPRVTHTVAVAATGDLNLSNNTNSEDTMILAVPTPSFVFTPSSPMPGQQAALALTIATPFPHEVSGTLRLAFSPDSAIGIDDPAIQFETGRRELQFVIPANATQARFTVTSQDGSVRFQTGTVAGTIAFSGTMRAGRLESTFSSSGLNGLSIPRQQPVIENVRTTMQGGFAALITSFSTGREITQLMLDFNTVVPVVLSCGTAPGCSASGNRITLNVASLFSSWFATDTMFGSVSTLRMPLSVSGTVQGTVTVTLRNNRGVSNPVTFPLP